METGLAVWLQTRRLPSSSDASAVPDLGGSAALLLVSGATPNDVREAAIAKGMRTMGNEAMTLVANDVTTIDEVVRNVYLA